MENNLEKAVGNTLEGNVEENIKHGENSKNSDNGESSIENSKSGENHWEKRREEVREKL